MRRWRTLSWDMDEANPNSATLPAGRHRVMPFGDWAAGQRDDVGFAPVIQLPVPVGLGPVPRYPFQARLGEAPLDAKPGAHRHIQGFSHQGSRPALVGLEQNPDPGAQPC